jgi:hypothetical protein
VALAALAAPALLAAGCRTGGAAAAPAPAPLATAPAPQAAPAVPLPAPPRLLAPADLDRLTGAFWAAAHVSPGPPAGDAEWLRRVTVDLAGRIPTLAEAEAFLADRAPDRRARLVDRLLASPDYAEHWADVFLDLYVGRQFRRPRLEKELDPRAYFVAAFRDNLPYDRLATDLITFTGEIRPNGPGVFLASHLKGAGPEAIASATARLFLGVQIQCAQCHDHPYDARYKQEDFYGLVAYFARTKYKQENLAKRAGNVLPSSDDMTETTMAATAGQDRDDPKDPQDKKNKDKRFFIIDKPRGQATYKKPNTTEELVAPPRFLGREVDPGAAPRDAVARAVVASDLFAKAAVGRFWAELFGRGIVDPWDDLGGEDDPKHPLLLRQLADDFRASGFDVRHLLRTIVLSRAYGTTSRGTGDDPGSFARAAVRRLTPEQLYRSLQIATGSNDDDKKIERLLREYLFVFGDDEGAVVNALASNIPQALLLWNGEVTNQGARARPGSTLAAILNATPEPAARLRRMFLTAYARPPTAEESARLLPGLAATPDYENLFFALLTSTEMLTNH